MAYSQVGYQTPKTEKANNVFLSFQLRPLESTHNKSKEFFNLLYLQPPKCQQTSGIGGILRALAEEHRIADIILETRQLRDRDGTRGRHTTMAR